MSTGSFDILSSLDEPNLVKAGNEAESLRGNPKHCLKELRDWLEYVLHFLEQKHSIPQAVAADYAGRGPNEYRIDRLPSCGVKLTEREIKVLHSIRWMTNKASHVAGNERYITSANSQKALNEAKLIRDWLHREYAPKYNQSHNYSRPTVAIANIAVNSKSGQIKQLRSLNYVPERDGPRNYVHDASQKPQAATKRAEAVIVAILIVLGLFAFLLLRPSSTLTVNNLPEPLQTSGNVKVLAHVLYDGIRSATLNYGQIIVTIDKVSGSGDGRIPVATVRYRDRVVAHLRGTRGRDNPDAEVSVIHLDPKATLPQVILTYFTGGAHCCTMTRIATADASGAWHIVDGETLDGAVGYSIVDLDGDGAYELESIDNSFLYEYGCYACSYAPLRITNLIGLELRDVTREAKYKNELRKHLRQMETSAMSRGDTNSNAYLGAWVAAKALVGELDDAWRTMLTSYDRQSDWGLDVCLTGAEIFSCPIAQKRRISFPNALANHLVKHFYMTSDQRKRLISISN